MLLNKLVLQVLDILRKTRAWLVYGQPYGRAPYGRFSDSDFFSVFRNFFIVFWGEKIQIFFYETDNFSSENLVGRKKFKKQIWWDKKIYEKKFDREKFIK